VLAVVAIGWLTAEHPAIYDLVPLLSSPHQEGIGELVDTSRACQTFLAQHNNLSQIEVQLDDLGRTNESSITFSLRTEPNAPQDLVTLTVDAATVDSSIYHTFAFPPLPDSEGQRYAFCLEAPEAGLDQAITAIGTLEDVYPYGRAVFRDMWGAEAGVQDLDFHVGYRLSLWQTLSVLLDRLAANKPYLCGTRWFYVVLGILYLAGLYALFCHFLPKEDEQRPDV